MSMTFSPTPDDDTAAAAITAIVACALTAPEAMQADADMPPRSLWSAAAQLSAQGLLPARSTARSTWSNAERTARARRWSYGIVGM